jgi:MerR family transcriptional regulator, light-induced transcriptional regulator
MDLPSKPHPTVDALVQSLQADCLDALIQGHHRQAEEVTQRALNEGMSAGDIYLNIFQNAAYEIGRLWQINRINVAQEHLATAIIERQMGEMHSYFKPKILRYKTVIIGCVEHEYHRVGPRMVADFFEQDGWNVIYLGPDVPTEAFVSMAHDISPDLIGVSAQMVIRLPALTEFINQLNRQGLGGIPIMAGGQPFIQEPELYKSLRVHFSANDARVALTRANQWMDRES